MRLPEETRNRSRRDVVNTPGAWERFGAWLARPLLAILAVYAGVWGAEMAWELPAIRAAYVMLYCSLLGIVGGALYLVRPRLAGWPLLVAAIVGYFAGLFWFDWTLYLGPALVFSIGGLFAVHARAPQAATPPPVLGEPALVVRDRAPEHPPS